MELKRIQVLAVNDDPSGFEQFEKMFSLASTDRLDLHLACGLREAADRLKEQPFDVTLLDPGLPENQGTETYQRLRALTTPLPIVLLVGEESEAFARAAVRLGAQDYLFRSELAGRALERSLLYAVEQQKSAEALRLSQQALGAVHHGIVLTEANGDSHPIVYCNDAYEEMTGYSAQHVSFSPLQVFQGENQNPQALGALQQALQQQKGCQVLLRGYSREGQGFWIELTLSPTCDALGKITHYVWVHDDVTQRIELEEQFRHSQKMGALGQLASGVSHDFNNLLTVISGYADLLLQQSEEEAPRLMLQEIRGSAERAATLTQRLLAFSRKQNIQPVNLQLNETIQNMEKMIRRLIGEDVALFATLAPELGSIYVDYGQIEQIVINLAVNARDAMPRGSEIHLSTRKVMWTEEDCNKRRDISPGTYVCLEVRDTGCGMSAETLSQIFEPFFTTKERGKGTGLGLAMVRGIVEQSGGFVLVESEVDKGSTFAVYFPEREQSLSYDNDDERVQLCEGGGETVLLVEDDQNLCLLNHLVLERAGYQILVACSGEEALRLSAQCTDEIKLLITDVVMPGMSGRELVEQLMRERSGLRVLYVSGYFDDAILKHGVRQEEVFFLEKPFTGAELTQKVREILDADHSRPPGITSPEARTETGSDS